MYPETTLHGVETQMNSAQHTHDTVHFVNDDRPYGNDTNQVRQVSHVTWYGVAVNVSLAIVKATAGFFANSNVLLADAVHTVSDLATDMAILIGVKYWTAPADATHPHGHRKIETMITLGIGVALALVGLGLGYDAISILADAIIAKDAARIPQHPVGSALLAAMLAAMLSIMSKELLYRWTAAKGVELGSSALIANAWHHRSDAISSIPPLIALGGELIGSRMGYNLWYLDPIGTIIVCFMLLQAAWNVMLPTLNALLDASADRKLCSAIRKTVLDTDGVLDTHKIRTRVICSNAVAVDLHVIVDENLSVARGHAIATDVKNRLLNIDAVEGNAKPVDVLVHIEPGNPEEPKTGSGCKNTIVDWRKKDDDRITHG